MKIEFNVRKICVFLAWTVAILVVGFHFGYESYPKIQDMIAVRDHAEDLASSGCEHPQCEIRLQLYQYSAACTSELFQEALDLNRARHPHSNCTVWPGTFYFWLIEHDAINKKIRFDTNHRSFIIKNAPNSKYYVTESTGERVGDFKGQGSCKICGVNNPDSFSFNKKEDDAYVQHCCSLNDGVYPSTPPSFSFKWREYPDCAQGIAFASLLINEYENA